MKILLMEDKTRYKLSKPIADLLVSLTLTPEFLLRSIIKIDYLKC